LNKEGHEIAIVVPYMPRAMSRIPMAKFIEQDGFMLRYENEAHGKSEICSVHKFSEDDGQNFTPIYLIHGNSMCEALENNYHGYCDTSQACDARPGQLCFLCAMLAFNSVAADFMSEFPLIERRDLNLIIANDWSTAPTFSVLQERHPGLYAITHKAFFLHNRCDISLSAGLANTGHKSLRLWEQSKLLRRNSAAAL
jgi:glycosyl transferase family 5 (putative starch synthase catalytic subunit)